MLSILYATPSDGKHYKNRSKYIVNIAKSMVGKRYKWGGDGPYGYDCSGFTKEVFEKGGISIPRLSKEQAKIGRKVYINQLRRGDLLFFTSKNHTTVNHVGIYIGNGKFIHASRFHHKVVISPFKDYKKYFKWGRRMT